MANITTDTMAHSRLNTAKRVCGVYFTHRCRLLARAVFIASMFDVISGRSGAPVT